MVFHDENTNEGIERVFEEVNQYLPFCGYGEDKVYLTNEVVVGNQLSVERSINLLLLVENGFTPEERKEGLHMERADFHAQMKFLQVQYHYMLWQAIIE